MNKRNKTYVVFAIATTLFTVIGTFLIVFLGLNSPDSVDGYPDYSYDEYVDHTEDKTVLLQDGAQLYEAESFILNYRASLEESVSASDNVAVVSEGNGSSLIFNFDSDSVMEAKLTLSLSYVSNNRKDTDARKVLDVQLNHDSVSLSGVKIQSSYNNLEFLENDLCVLSLKKGKNVLELTSTTDEDLSFDYLVLTTNVQKRRDNEKGNGKVHWFSFHSKEDRNVMEAELANNDKGIFVNDIDASNEHSLYMAEETSKVTFPINSDLQISSDCSIILKQGNKLNSCKIKITLNDKEIYNGSLILSNLYQEFNIGSFTFKRGENTLTIENENGVFYLDCLILNSNFNYSEKNVNYSYEAEDSFINGGAVEESENAMNGKYVVNGSVQSSIDFEIKSPLQSSSLAILRIGYNGDECRLSNILDITWNGKTLPTLSIVLSKSSSLDTFANVSLGKLTLQRGLNVLHIVCLKNVYSLDSLVLSNSEMTESNHSRIEAENILCSRKEALTFGINSQEQLSQCLYEGDSVSYFFHSNQRLSLNVSLVLSLRENITIPSSEELLFSVNGRDISPLDNELSYGGGLHFFVTFNFGNISVSNGVNVLSIRCLSFPILIDSMIFSW